MLFSMINSHSIEPIVTKQKQDVIFFIKKGKREKGNITLNINIQTLCFLQSLQIELSCLPFLFIIFEMFLHLDWSAPVVGLIDAAWFVKAHTCLCKCLTDVLCRQGRNLQKDNHHCYTPPIWASR